MGLAELEDRAGETPSVRCEVDQLRLMLARAEQDESELESLRETALVQKRKLDDIEKYIQVHGRMDRPDGVNGPAIANCVFRGKAFAEARMTAELKRNFQPSLDEHKQKLVALHKRIEEMAANASESYRQFGERYAAAWQREPV